MNGILTTKEASTRIYGINYISVNDGYVSFLDGDLIAVDIPVENLEGFAFDEDMAEIIVFTSHEGDMKMNANGFRCDGEAFYFYDNTGSDIAELWAEGLAINLYEEGIYE